MLPGDWQVCKQKLSQRGQHLLETSLWSDCKFVVGTEPNQQVFECHKLILAISSPVFEAMFFGKMAEKDYPIPILDVQAGAFKALLEYIYSDTIILQSFDQACELCYVAKKYMLPYLVKECTDYIWKDLNSRNVCRAYEFANLYEEPKLMARCMETIQNETSSVLSDPSFVEVELSTLLTIFDQDALKIDTELELFSALNRWSQHECSQKGLSMNDYKSSGSVINSALKKIRFLTLTPTQFAEGPATSCLLSQEESFAILMNISSTKPCKVLMPEGFSTINKSRKLGPVPLTQPGMLTDLSREGHGHKYYCLRNILTQPECLNTSILDCSVTFTVDRNICILGVQVPTQVMAMKEDKLHGPGESTYSELLYAHLLDSDGSRLTYTHFTSRVCYRSLVEIGFNRPYFIQRNKVYRVGVVLNKVGWYPIGECSQKTTLNNVFFSFCVGNSTENVRDGLIRSIVFTY